MDSILMSCPTCSSQIQVPFTIDKFYCLNCGTELIIERGSGFAVLKNASPEKANDIEQEIIKGDALKEQNRELTEPKSATDLTISNEVMASNAVSPVSTPNMNAVVLNVNRNPGCLTQFLWFLFIGWWASLLWVSTAYLFILIIIGIPVGIWMLNRVPKVIALRSPELDAKHITIDDLGRAEISKVESDQINFFIRAIYFLLVGWWFTAFWLSLGWLISLTIIGLPIALWIFDKTPVVLTLQQGN